jgi:hypothetical protein
MNAFVAVMNAEQTALCEAIKRLGYARDKQVKLYGEVFLVLSDPLMSGELVFVDAEELKSGRHTRLCIPKTVVRMAEEALLFRT